VENGYGFSPCLIVSLRKIDALRNISGSASASPSPKNDTRPESFTPNLDTMRIGERLSTAANWRARREIVRPLMRPSLCAIQHERDTNRSPTLGIFKPGQITRLVIEDAEQPSWTPEQLNTLRQIQMFQSAPAQELEKIPFDFKYKFCCSESSCSGHNLTCFDGRWGKRTVAGEGNTVTIGSSRFAAASKAK
jgi:hypothetical protein